MISTDVTMEMIGTGRVFDLSVAPVDDCLKLEVYL